MRVVPESVAGTVGAGWRIGNASEAFQEQTLPDLRNGAAFDAWLARLRPLRQR